MMEIYEKLRNIFIKKNIPFPDDDNAVLSIDSLGLMMLVYEIQNEFGIQFGLDDFDEELTVRYFLTLIEKRQ